MSTQESYSEKLRHFWLNILIYPLLLSPDNALSSRGEAKFVNATLNKYLYAKLDKKPKIAKKIKNTTTERKNFPKQPLDYMNCDKCLFHMKTNKRTDKFSCLVTYFRTGFLNKKNKKEKKKNFYTFSHQ